ncbi:class I SAM-dependent methyltransferase [Elusimicrobiota bacterium]
MPEIKPLIKGVLRRTISKISAFWYSGETFICPICNGHFRRMKSYKKSYYIKGELVDCSTKNAICPNCYSDIRHRFILIFLTKNTNLLSENIKLLHFAPETGIMNYLNKQENIEYIACDIDPSRYSKAIKVDITDIIFADNSFDAIICNQVLEHIRDDLRAIKELYRVLKPGGWVLLSVPIYGETTFEQPELDYKGREKMYGIGEHMRLNGLDLERKLTKEGFSVSIYSIDDIPGEYVDRSVHTPHTESDKYLFYCIK